MAAKTNAIFEEAQRRAQGLLSRWPVPSEFMAELIEHSALVTFAKEEPIFLQGSTADLCYCVLTGLVKVYFPLRDGARVIVRVAGPGDFVGIIDSIGTNARRVQAFEAEAMTKVSVAIFSRDHILAMLRTMNPPDLATLVEEINTTWSEAFCWCTKFLGLSLHDRLQWVFQNLGSRFGVRDSRGILLTLELSHDDLAEMIASSRPMVSRIIAEFMERGELVRQGKHYILTNAATNLACAQPSASKPTGPVARDHRVRRLESVAKRARL